MIILDVWGGDLKQEHVARYILPMQEALKLAATELDTGFLVNLRKEAAWGKYENFDDRIAHDRH